MLFVSSSICPETKIQLHTKEKFWNYFLNHSNVLDRYIIQKVFLSKYVFYLKLIKQRKYLLMLRELSSLFLVTMPFKIFGTAGFRLDIWFVFADWKWKKKTNTKPNSPSNHWMAVTWNWNEGNLYACKHIVAAEC